MMHGLQILFLSAIFFAAALASAQTSNLETEQIHSGRNARGERVYVLLYKESRLWHLEEIVQHADGWQDLISRKYFNSREEALQAQTTVQARYTQLQTLPLMAEPSVEMVLQGGSLWPTTETWSWDWEKKYGEWLKQNMNADFFKKHQVATDCADVAYAARWIFARIHGLPVANRLSGSSTLLTNQSLRPEWKNLPTAKNWYEDKRFRAALNYLLNMTYTHTLMRDSYPIAINADNFLAGAHFLNLHERSGHTQLVHRVDLGEGALIPFLIVQSTVPRKVREVNESLFWGTEPVQKNMSGFLRILWPKIRDGVYSIDRPENMPGYSLEQYAPDFIRAKDRAYSLEVMLRLKPNLDFVAILKGGFHNLREMLKIRQGLVEEGFKQCPSRSCKPDSSLYDDWSTPSRDKQIGLLMLQLKMISAMPFPGDISRDIRAAFKQEMETVILQLDGVDFTMNQAFFVWDNQTFSSDPNDEPGLRWSLAPEFMAKSFETTLKRNWEERKSKVTVEGDNIMRAQFIISKGYCLVFSEAQCTRLKAELQNPLELSGQKRSLEAWLEFTLWLNSDLRQSRENQWGGLRAKSKYYVPAGKLKKFLVAGSGFTYIESAEGPKKVGFVDSQGFQEMVLPAGFTWEQFDQKNSVAWAQASHQLLRYDFKTKTQQVVDLPVGEEFKILHLEGNVLKLATSQEILNIRVENAAAVVLWRGPAENARFLRGSILAGQQNSQWQFFDFSKDQPQVLPVPLDLSSSVIFNLNSRHVGFTAASKFWVLEKSTGMLTDITHVGAFLKWSEGFSEVLVMNPLEKNAIYLRSLDDKFQVVKEQKVADFGTFIGDYFLTFDGGVRTLFAFKGEKFLEVPLLKDEEKYAYIGDNIVSTLLKGGEGKQRLRRTDGSKTFYTGKVSFMGSGIQSEKDPMVFWSGNYDNFQDIHLKSLKDPMGPALMNGQFIAFSSLQMVEPEGAKAQISIEKGILMEYQGFRFWVDFP